MSEAASESSFSEAVDKLDEKMERSQRKSMPTSEPCAGRVLFRGVHMAFLTVNGRRMLTLHEILGKLLPTTSRSTFCARLQKMNPVRHECTGMEIRKLKALEGAKPSAIKCTVIARKTMAEYCEKYGSENDAGGDATKNSASRVKNWREGEKKRGVRNQFATSSGVAENESASMVSDDESGSQQALEDLPVCRSDISAAYVGSVKCKRDAKAEAMVSDKENVNSEKQNTSANKQDVQLSDSGGKCVNTGVISQAVTRRAEEKIQLGERANKHCRIVRNWKRSSDPFESSKHETNPNACDVEIHGDETFKRQRTYHLKGNNRRVNKGEFQTSTEKRPSPKHPYSRSNLTRTEYGGLFEAPSHEAAKDGLENLPGRHRLDVNNNDVEESQEPCSPTLVLKRSTNNEWRVAKSRLPRENLQSVEVTEGGEQRSFFIGEASQTLLTHSFNAGVADKTNAKHGRATSPHPLTITRSTSSKTLTRAAKTGITGSPVLSEKKKLKETTARNANKRKSLKTDQQESAANPQYRRGSLAVVRDTCSDAKSIGKGARDSATNFAKPNSSVYQLGGKNRRKDAETKRFERGKSVGFIPQGDISKTNRKVVRRRQRIHLNTFRLIETVPYSSLLVVSQDGDLSPSFTMTYSASKQLPGCCHLLWRWRLGKAVLDGKRMAVTVSKSTASEPQNEGKCVQSELTPAGNQVAFEEHTPNGQVEA